MKGGRFNPFDPGPTLAQCPACSAKLTRRPNQKRWWVADWVLWLCFCAMLGLRTTFWTVIFIIMISVAWNEGRNRLWQSFWKWRHPLRCEEGGHAEPLPGSN